MAKTQLEVAIEALDFNERLEKVFVSTDSKVFIDKNSAVNHSVKNELKVEGIKDFDRSVLDSELKGDHSPEELKEMAVELGLEITEDTTLEEIKAFVEKELS